MNSFGKFKDEQLPPKDAFYSILHGEDISDEENKHAQNVWNKFNIKSMGEYHDLYLGTDVLLLLMFLKNLETYALSTTK